MGAVNILVVDDETAVLEILRKGFEAEGWTVHVAQSPSAMFEALKTHAIDLVTLDLVHDQEDGLELARTLRASWNIPILMISGRTGAYDRIRGLESGADDYIAKPFHIREVVLRVRRTLELYGRELSGHDNLLFDHTVFDPERGIVQHFDGTPVDLTGIELKLLELFVRHPGRILSRDEISQSLHGRDWSPEDRTIDGHVARLRRKLGTSSDVVNLIRSVRGVGYVFTGDVQVARSAAATTLRARNRLQ
ncbi:response regulator transcription factor [Alloyangia pacifica]|uniref:response regulator transcription factor n=1 Tax=Alloyangia pacifica TaxID=311180 RepID=UPI001CD2EA94|nr:response regulator transcription factor [Alloyangia pacifica]MCA0995752.1 response regulator transcription factor [Alloyangia pacifica]